MSEGLPLDAPREACGVFGICSQDMAVAKATFYALYALQHRGQEAAGIATTDGQRLCVHKDTGLVSQVFDEQALSTLVGTMAIGHNRYSTKGSSLASHAQPYTLETIAGPLAIAHNGNVVNAGQMRQDLLALGGGFTTASDSEVILMTLAYHAHQGWQESIRHFMAQAEGAYTLVILTREGVYGVRDPWGLRPLVLGQRDSTYMLASESCAFATVGARMIREIEPGEIVHIPPPGCTYDIMQGHAPHARAFCTFEEIYFARPDSVLQGRLVHQKRQAMGRQLAREAPATADWVVSVPDSGTPHAIGYAQESGIPYTEGLTKSRYIGRTFIQPSDELRKTGVAMKFNPLNANLEGQRIVLVDDSIVRGNTVGPLIRMLRDGGACEVHVRVASPPITHPCFMGVDMASQAELIAANRTVPDIEAQVGADSLAYLSLEGLCEVLAQMEGHGYCNACFTGKYPFDEATTAWTQRDTTDVKLEFASVFA